MSKLSIKITIEKDELRLPNDVREACIAMHSIGFYDQICKLKEIDESAAALAALSVVNKAFNRSCCIRDVEDVVYVPNIILADEDDYNYIIDRQEEEEEDDDDEDDDDEDDKFFSSYHRAGLIVVNGVEYVAFIGKPIQSIGIVGHGAIYDFTSATIGCADIDMCNAFVSRFWRLIVKAGLANKFASVK